MADRLYWPSFMMEEMFCSHWNRHRKYGVAVPSCNASAKTVIHEFTEYLIQHCGIPHSILSIPGTHFIAEQVQPWTYDHGTCPHHSEVNTFIE